MALGEKKLTVLTADTSPTIDDLIYTVSAPGGTPVSRKVTLEDLFQVVGFRGDSIGADFLVDIDISLLPDLHVMGGAIPIVKTGFRIEPNGSITSSEHYFNVYAAVFSHDSLSGNKVAVFAGAMSEISGAYVWGMNPLVQVQPGVTSGANLCIEADVNNFGDDSTSPASPLGVWGLEVSGVQGATVKRSFCAVGVAGAYWQYGLAFFNNAFSGSTDGAYIHVGDSIYPDYLIEATYTKFGKAAIALPNDDKICFINSSSVLTQAVNFDADDMLILGHSTNSMILIDNGLIVQNSTEVIDSSIAYSSPMLLDVLPGMIQIAYDNVNDKGLIRSAKWGVSFSDLYIQAADIRFSTGMGVPTEHTVITANGDFGLGTATPSFKLDVVGTIKGTGLIITGDTYLEGGKVSYTANDTAGAGYRYVIVPNA
jgi:hypothetical protein